MFLLPERIAQIAQISPSASALLSEEGSLTYLQLNRRVNRLTNYLASLGVKDGDTVAICQLRSFDQIVSALAVMRAGAAYVPIDPAWPDERVRHILSDSGASILLSSRDQADRLSSGIKSVCLVEDAPTIEASSPIYGETCLSPEGLAYVIYTSGSTGTPKGVEITRANLLHLIDWHCSAFAVTADDHASHLAGLGFDASVWEMWPYLSIGASVTLVTDEMVRTSPTLLQQWLVREKITIAFVPTPLAEPMLSMSWPDSTSLRFLLTGGDTLHAVPKSGQPFTLVNNYGPTECTVVATSGTVGSHTAGVPTLGHPIAGTATYVLRQNGDPAEVGEPGELYIGGNGVGRGYRNLPELTASSFVPDRFSGVPNSRLYKTGDRAVKLADGQLAFLGRGDGQVKIRGQRIETGEIISALSRHSAIAFNTVVAVGEADDKHLVAYVLTRGEDSLSAADLRRFLSTTLPDSMIPAIFVRLTELPLSGNGKVDVGLLPQPGKENTLAEVTSRAACSPVEEMILAIVQRLLRVENVGVEDDFFLIGGHSLMGTQLVLRIRDTFGVRITLRDLFDCRSVAQLSTKVEALLLQDLESMSEEEALRQVGA